MKYRLFPALPILAMLCFGASRAAEPDAASKPSAPVDTAGSISADDSEAAAVVDSAQAPVSPAPSLVLDYAALERRAQDIHPILREKRLEIDKAEQRLREIEMAAILPRFTMETGMGPAPGMKSVPDSTSLRLPGSGEGILQFQREFDFNDWGPFFGIEFTVAQPLNVSRYRAGHKAAASSIKVSEAEFHKERMDVSEESQRLYFQRLYAGRMQGILNDAAREMDRAQKRIENLLDEGDQSVRQTDLLELRVGRYALEKGRSEANLGVIRSELGLRFLIQAPDSVPVALQDSNLTLRPEALPSLDSLKMLTLMNHPDLKRLANGLAARRELLRVAKGEIGPDIFLFANFKYTKAWSTDRQSSGDNPFARDPLNEITAVGGLGMKLNLNFWQRYQKVRKERIELVQLERTEIYAARGLLLRMQDEYAQMLATRTNVSEAQKSLRAAEAWLKGAALNFDLDPSLAKEMISPYRAVLSAKKEYFEAVMNYNVAVAKVIKSIGWTLTDYIHSLDAKGG